MGKAVLYSLTAWSFFAVTMFAFADPAVAPEVSGESVAPLSTVTAQTLTSLRAATRSERRSPQSVETSQGLVDIDLDGMSDQLFAPITLCDAFSTVPLCQEWGPPSDSPRFSFAIEANERLVDALDKLRHNSDSYLDWMLLHGRIVITANAIAGEAMNRPIRVEVEAETLQGAFEQIEAAYNGQYNDVPLIASPMYVRLLLKTRPVVLSQGSLFKVQMEGSVREAVLTILDQTEDQGICYSLSEITDSQNRHYLALRMNKRDAPELDKYLDENEYLLHEAMLEESNQRLDAYLATNAEKAAQAAEQTGGGDGAP